MLHILLIHVSTSSTVKPLHKPQLKHALQISKHIQFTDKMHILLLVQSPWMCCSSDQWTKAPAGWRRDMVWIHCIVNGHTRRTRRVSTTTTANSLLRH